jgi:3-hydroxypropanoate dehydrogenase
MNAINEDAVKQLFTEARTANGFTAQQVPAALLKEIYELAKWGATSMNTQPARYVALTSSAAKERLLPSLSPGNVEKTKSAPVTVIVARDTKFYEYMPQVWHGPNADKMFADNPGMAVATAVRGTTLSGAYFMLAARALGLDCGPMSGFDNAKVDAAFFPDGRLQSDFLLNLGYADHSKTFKRNPRLTFEQAVTVLT